MKPLATLLLSAALSMAAPINPPSPGEGDTLAIVSALCPTCERQPDLIEPVSGYWIFAFEDRNDGHGDYDYNDLIVEAWFENGALLDWRQVASYTIAQQSFGFDGRWVFDAATGPSYVGTVWSNPALNAGGRVQVAGWTLPTPVPEPSPLIALLFCGLAWWTWRKR